MKKIISLFIAILCVVSFSACGSENKADVTTKDEATVTQTEETTIETTPDYETEALDILNSTSFMDSVDPAYVQYGLSSDITFGALLAIMFEDPEIKVSPTLTTDGELLGYSVTVSGNYCDTPGGYYINQGNAYITISLSRGTCTLNGDHYFKSAATNYAYSVTGLN